jgi:predicted phosphodiesterase
MSRKWAEDGSDDRELEKLVKQGLLTEEIAKKMGRSFKSIAHRRSGLSKNNTRIMTQKKETQIITPEDLFNKIIPDIKRNMVEVKYIKPDFKNKKEETSVLILSDMHIGMINEVYDSIKGVKTVTYNTEIRRLETMNLIKSIYQIHSIFSHGYKLENLVIFMLGDIVTNDRIFEGQKFEIEECVGRQILHAVPDLANTINQLKKIYKTITIICVVGNHGRSTDNYEEEPVENNFEYHLYLGLEKIFAGDSRVKVIVPNTRDYSYKIYEHTFYITHGDRFRGFTDDYIKRMAKELYVANPYDVLAFGHYHRSMKNDVNERAIYLMNGSFIAKDNYGFKVSRSYSKPTQWFFGCNYKRSITWNFAIDLTK